VKTPPIYKRYLDTTEQPSGFSTLSSTFWRTAEGLRDDAVRLTANQHWMTHWTVPSIVCLYHAALDCFINEEITIAGEIANKPLGRRHEIQGMTIHGDKLDGLFAYFGVAGPTADVRRRTLLLAGLRNRLIHHWPEMRDLRDYPVQVIEALNDAKIEKGVNTPWTGQCSDIRVAKWAAEIVRAFVEEWWQVGRAPDWLARAQWEYGRQMVYPSHESNQ
jgi:hypothetical protein